MATYRTRWNQEGLDPEQPLLRVGLANRRRDTPFEGMHVLNSFLVAQVHIQGQNFAAQSEDRLLTCIVNELFIDPAMW